MPIVGDTMLLSEKSADSERMNQVTRKLQWKDRTEVFEKPCFQRGCLILPEFVPDSQI